MISRTLVLLCFILVATTLGVADELRQKLDLSNSSLWFAATSPQQISGTFRTYDGVFTRIGPKISDSKVSLLLNLESVSMPPDQIMQALFIQTALGYLREKTVRFESDEITLKSPKDLLVRGSYNWQGKERRVEVPVELISARDNRTEFKVLVAGRGKPDMSQVKGIPTGIWNGKAGARLVFRR